MKHYVDYDGAGRIIQATGGNWPIAVDPALTRMEIEHAANPDYEYVLAGALDPRPSNPSVPDKTTFTADEVDMVTISSIPNPSDVSITGPGTTTMVTVTDGALEVTASTPGEYTVLIASFPEQDKTIVLEATS